MPKGIGPRVHGGDGRACMEAMAAQARRRWPRVHGGDGRAGTEAMAARAWRRWPRMHGGDGRACTEAMAARASGKHPQNSTCRPLLRHIVVENQPIFHLTDALPAMLVENREIFHVSWSSRIMAGNAGSWRPSSAAGTSAESPRGAKSTAPAASRLLLLDRRMQRRLAEGEAGDAQHKGDDGQAGQHGAVVAHQIAGDAKGHRPEG